MDEEASQNITHGDGQMDAMAPTSEEKTIDIPMVKVKPDPDQPRSHFDELEHKWLTESIAKSGVLQPILVRPIEDGSFMIIAGERRYRAAQAAGRASIPAVVVSQDTRPLEAIDVKELALMENLQRSDLNDYDVAVGVTEYLRSRLGFHAAEEVAKFLRRMYNGTLRAEDQKHVEPTKAMFRRLGRSWRTFTSTQLTVFALHPEIQQQLRLSKLDLSKARVLNRVRDEETRRHLMWSAIANGWTRSQLRREIADLNKGIDLPRAEEVRRAEIASSVTAFRKAYVQSRRSLTSATLTQIEQLIAQLNSLVANDIQEPAGDVPTEERRAA